MLNRFPVYLLTMFIIWILGVIISAWLPVQFAPPLLPLNPLTQAIFTFAWLPVLLLALYRFNYDSTRLIVVAISGSLLMLTTICACVVLLFNTSVTDCEENLPVQGTYQCLVRTNYEMPGSGDIVRFRRLPGTPFMIRLAG